ncbi:MAG: Dolichyl-phosphate-mannose-protein mannosyltransferase protein [Candidatus Levybacteria bacterium GW2011_GWA1_39_11]|nr:MAG: Dolichyl-phosphate-mannose-protein mannosyltransferase protein [Candidatus Levybacteria bacterium GW2011_GWA1_39_11]
MFQAAILIGIYSYIIFALGLLGLLYKNTIILVTIIFIVSVFLSRKSLLTIVLHSMVEYTSKIFEINSISKLKKVISKDKLRSLLTFLLLVQIVINLIGALAPERAFDALWYHLTIPKLYLQSHSIYHIPGGLLYYSDMPKLVEMIYTAALAFGSEITAKMIHYFFGVLSLITIFLLGKKYLSQKTALISVLIFYSNPVVSWQSTTAFVDLGRTFFEILALFAFINLLANKQKKWLFLTALMVGLAVTTKILAIFSVVIFSVLLIIFRKSIAELVIFISISILIPLPWFIFSLLNTGNPFYPLFSSIPLPQGFDFISSLKGFWHSPDPISPIYIIIFPLLLMMISKFKLPFRVISLYSFLAFIFWLSLPPSAGSRFIMPYLPAFSILSAAVINFFPNKMIQKYLILIVVLISLVTIGYRSQANSKYIPVILGFETRESYLAKNLNFSFGDFYDVDGYFKNKIKEGDRVLIIGSHNLYYVNFPYVHESWLKDTDYYNYVLVQNTDLPEKLKSFKKIYENRKTNVKLYSK